MEIQLLLSLLGPTVAIIGGYFLLNAKIQELRNLLDRHDENVSKNFDRHKEEHQEHHKEIAKMFDAVTKDLYRHIEESNRNDAVQSQRISDIWDILRGHILYQEKREDNK